jgi:histidinol dehydrogenase
MKHYDYRSLNQSEREALLRRPGSDFSDIMSKVREVLLAVSERGDDAVRQFTRQFDDAELESFGPSENEFAQAKSSLKDNTKQAILDAAISIRAYHTPQFPQLLKVQTRPGVDCRLEWRPIRRVGLYVPGGSAPLVSTLLMLAIPAQIAGCQEIAVFTPPRHDGSVSFEILFAAEMLGITSVFKIGGSQAIAAMAFGTGSVPRVDKIFGPGNRYVAAAKAVVAQPPYNVSVDMIAGPTELLIIADDSSNPEWIASDLLSQAEHGVDSQVVLVTPSKSLKQSVEQRILEQLSSLPRSAIARQALENSAVVLVEDIDEAIRFSNLYAPEHLIIATKSAPSLVSTITNAGSVFLGRLTSVVFGDYASGTNHTLPTGGSASATGGLTVGSFMKPISFQTVAEEGLQSLARTTAILAEAEGLEGHARAARMREARHD